MTEYHKIPGPFRREQEKPFRVLEGEWTSPELEYLADLDWRWTEKVDGTNVRVIWDGHRVTFGGRTDNAQLPPRLHAALTDLFLVDGVEEAFEQTWGETPVVLYGEGYGGKIQGGGKYRSDESFVLFDVRVGTWWLRYPDVRDVAESFSLEVVPEILVGPIRYAVEIVREGLASAWATAKNDFPIEGLVGTPAVPLFGRAGRRIIVKVKSKDFQ